MGKLKASELHGKKLKELNTELDELKDELSQVRQRGGLICVAETGCVQTHAPQS